MRLLKRIRAYITARKMLPTTFFSFFDLQNNGLVTVGEFFTELQKKNIKAKLERIEKLSEYVNGKCASSISIAKLVEWYERVDFPDT